jgi:hypothetical protein
MTDKVGPVRQKLTAIALWHPINLKPLVDGLVIVVDYPLAHSANRTSIGRRTLHSLTEFGRGPSLQVSPLLQGPPS